MEDKFNDGCLVGLIVGFILCAILIGVLSDRFVKDKSKPVILQDTVIHIRNGKADTTYIYRDE